MSGAGCPTIKGWNINQSVEYVMNRQGKYFGLIQKSKKKNLKASKQSKPGFGRFIAAGAIYEVNESEGHFVKSAFQGRYFESDLG